MNREHQKQLVWVNTIVEELQQVSLQEVSQELEMERTRLILHFRRLSVVANSPSLFQPMLKGLKKRHKEWQQMVGRILLDQDENRGMHG
jgi:predicted RNA-binding protein with PUA-like domain